MKPSKAGRTPVAHHAVYRDFKRLDREPRLRLALRILHDEKMLADLYDHFLIRRSLDEPGQNIAWESHAQQNGSGH